MIIIYTEVNNVQQVASNIIHNAVYKNTTLETKKIINNAQSILQLFQW